MKIEQNFSHIKRNGRYHECHFTDIDGSFFKICYAGNVGCETEVQVLGPGDFDAKTWDELRTADSWGEPIYGFLRVMNLTDTHFGIYIMQEPGFPEPKQLHIVVTPWIAQRIALWQAEMIEG